MNNKIALDSSEVFRDALQKAINTVRDIMYSNTHKSMDYLLPVCLQKDKSIYSMPVTNVYYRPKKKMYCFEFRRTGDKVIRICCIGIDNHGNWEIIMDEKKDDWEKFFVATEVNMTLEDALKKYIFKF